MIMEWTSVLTKMPDTVGQYMCKDFNGKEFPNFFVSTFSGKKQWVTYGSGIEVAAWKEIPIEITASDNS
jgi:hypothetical protein